MGSPAQSGHLVCRHRAPGAIHRLNCLGMTPGDTMTCPWSNITYILIHWKQWRTVKTVKQSFTASRIVFFFAHVHWQRNFIGVFWIYKYVSTHMYKLCSTLLVVWSLHWDGKIFKELEKLVSCVNVGDSLLGRLPIHAGVRQRDYLPPILFTLVINDVWRNQRAVLRNWYTILPGQFYYMRMI